MASADSSDYREKRDRDRDRAKSPSTPINGQGARNIRMSNIESSVTRLLVATKQLIETLTGWSRRQATETDVSDVYVRLGNEFNIARTCFERAGIEMSDLSEIPSQLRQVLETCLARDASPRVLEIYLPKVREIVINLLQGLKRKQARYRARTHETEEDTAKNSPRQRSSDLKIMSPPSNAEVNSRRQSPARRVAGPREESIERKGVRSGSQTRNSGEKQQPVITTQSATPEVSDERPRTNQAFQKLQTSDALQRRASKRYSAYNLAKLDGFDVENGVRNAPPVPTRRSGSFTPDQTKSPKPDRGPSPRRKSPERRPVETPVPEEDENSRPSSTVPVSTPASAQVEPQSRQDSPEKLPVFLQLGSAVRKTMVSPTELSLQSLRLLFIEKFQFNPGSETFPDVLVTDKDTGVRYIFEEGTQDIVEGTVLTLDVEVDSTLKRTFNEGMTALMKEVSTLQQTIISQQALLSRLADQHSSLREDLTSHRDETIRKIEDISFKPATLQTTTPGSLKKHIDAVKSFKRDLSSLKAEHNAFVSGLNTSLSQIRDLPFSSAVQVVTGDDLESQKASLESKTQALVTISDDLSDQVDDLRIDITQKRVRPHPRTITMVRKQGSAVETELESVESLLRQLKPMWKRKWEDELQQVIDGQEFLRHQETLIGDLRKDLADTDTVIAQIIQAAELFEASGPREWLSGAVGSGGRDAVLGEVRTLQPNSAERLEAIKRAEKARLRELEMRRETEFQLELGEVVTEGRLRTMGEQALRVEREREEKERKMRRDIWEERKHQKPAKSNGTPSVERTVSDVSDKAYKRAISAGSSIYSEPSGGASDDGVSRSQSYSSGLSRVKAITEAVGKRFSGVGVRRANSRGSGSIDGDRVGIDEIE